MKAHAHAFRLLKGAPCPCAAEWAANPAAWALRGDRRPDACPFRADDGAEHGHLHHNPQLSDAVLDSASEGILITDPTGKIIRVNHAFTAVTGYSEEETVGQTPRMLQSGRHNAQFYAELWTAVTQRGHWEGEIWNRNKAGAIYRELLTINAVRSADGNLTHFVGVFTDVTARKQTEARLHHLAYHDPLTGLANRTLLDDRLRQAIVLATRADTRFAVLYIDLDEFGAVNNALGHEAGDRLLVETARRIQGQVREGDTLARQGGDEFVVLAESCHGHGSAAAIARRILEALLPALPLAAGEAFVTASIGIANFPDDGCTRAELLTHADAAMYRAKAAGGNRLRFFAEAVHGSVGHRPEVKLGLVPGLVQELEHGDLRLEFEPIFRFGAASPHAAEALLRWDPPVPGALLPSSFQNYAARNGTTAEVDRWQLQSAFGLAAEWGRAGADLRIAINLSPGQLIDAGLTGRIRALLKEHGLSGERVVLEVPERALWQYQTESRSVLAALHDLGVRTVVDHVRSGHVTRSFLRRYPISGLKIDGSVIADVTRDETHAAFVRTLVATARKLKIEIGVEGVETPAQLQFLSDLGCDWLQGHLLGGPMAPSALAACHPEWPCS